MQYIDTASESQYLYFPLPINRTETLVQVSFTSYERNFQVSGTATYGTHFAKVLISLSAEQRAYFNDATTWEVHFGSSTIHVQGPKPSSTVIEYQS